MPAAPPDRPRTGRARNEQARRDILAAALALARDDLGGTTVDAIALRAGVGKQTIYRWWPSKWAVILEALLGHAERDVVTGDGTPAERLITFLVSSFALLTGPGGDGPLLRALMARAQTDPGFAVAWRDTFVGPRRQALLRLLGDGPPEDREAAADLIFGGMWYRLLVGHGPLDEDYARRLATAATALLTGDRATRDAR
jgi:AcrR family transcriptional regulator